MGFAKPIEQIFIKLSRYIYVSKRYYTRRYKMLVEVSMKDKKKAERRYQEYLKKMNKKKGEQKK